MKLKLIAAAAALALSGAANAAIDTGTDGSGDFFLTMWDGAQSYTVDLNLQMSDFTSGVAAPGSFSFSLNLASDAVFAAFISTANLANMVWNLTAVESQGARTLIQTYTDLPATGIPNSDARTMVSGVQAFAGAVNNGIAAQGNSDSAVFAAGEAGYANNTTGVRYGSNNGGLLNFNNSGTFANNSYAAGLNLVSMAIATTGIAPAIYSPLADAGTALRAYIGPDYTLHITAAVPEPETYAMLLAGLGLMGAIARRRRQQG
jgi:hypothetical protein